MAEHGVCALAQAAPNATRLDIMPAFPQTPAPFPASPHRRWLIALVLLSGFFLTLIIPPMKSPDEWDHVKRAYLLSQGVLFLHTEKCEVPSPFCQRGSSMSGGNIDRGLADYIAATSAPTPLADRAQAAARFQSIPWAGTDVFGIAPGTGYYMPLIYSPQAVGFAIGKLTGMSVHNSYLLGRFLNISACVLIIAWAFSIFRVPLVAPALLLLPMSLFQAVSTSIDMFSSALAVLALSCFLRAYDERTHTPARYLWIMAIAIFLVGTARAHLTAMLLLPFVTACLIRSPLAWLLSLASTSATLLWMAAVIPATVDFRVARGASTGEVAKFYLGDPARLIDVLTQTFHSADLQMFYWRTFFGVFHNGRISDGAANLLALLLVLIILASIAPWRELKSSLTARAALLATGLASAVLAFLAMLFSWTPHPATIVEGVQGRYLLVPVILVAVACCSFRPAPPPVLQKVETALLYLLFSISLFLTTRILLSNYYL